MASADEVGPVASRPWVRDACGLAVVLVVFGALAIRYLAFARNPFVANIDEAQYLALALDDYDAFVSSGPVGWMRSVLKPTIQAPLTTAAATPFFLAVGRNYAAALLVPITFSLTTILLTWLLGRELGGRRGGWLALAVTAGALVVVLYGREFNFAAGSAATSALALWSLQRSDRLRSTVWSLAAGVSAGMFLLSRTMSVALVPGLIVAGLVASLAGPLRRVRLRNLAFATVMAGLVAGPWWFRNGRRVWTYLLSFGYQQQTDEYGGRESVLSPLSWLHTLQYVVSTNGVIWSAVVIVLLGAAMVLAARRLKQGGIWAAARSPILVTTLFLAVGLAALTSSGNKGSGFLAPLIPCAAALVGWFGAKIRGRGALLSTTVLATLAIGTTLATAGPPLPVPSPMVANRGGRPFVLLDLRGLSQAQFADGDTRTGGSPGPSPSELREWDQTIRDVTRGLESTGGRSAPTAWGFRHMMVNMYSIDAADRIAGGSGMPSMMIDAGANRDAAALEAWLITGVARGACHLLISAGDSHEFAPVGDHEALEIAASRAGFRDSNVRWGLPDGRVIAVWQRPAMCR